MDLRHLISFQTIVREGSFLRAAEVLQYAQSTITLHIQQLEAQLGVKLFARQGRNLALTEAGQILLDQAEPILRHLENLQRTLADMASGQGGEVRLGVIEPTASLRLPAVLLDFCTRYPKVKVHIETGGTQHISQLVAAGALDAGICSSPPGGLNLHFEPLFEEEMALLLPQGHHLACTECISPEQLEGTRLLLTEPGCAYRALIEQSWSGQPQTPYSGIEVDSAEIIKRLVQKGLGAAILPRISITPPPPGTVTMRLTKGPLALHVGIVQQAAVPKFSPALERFLQLIRAGLIAPQRSA